MVIILPGLVSPSRRWSCRSSSSRFLWEIHWCDRTPSTRPGQRCWMWNNDQQKLKGKYQYCLSEWYVKSLLSINICSNYIFVNSLSFRSSCRTENVRQKFCFTYCKVTTPYMLKTCNSRSQIIALVLIDLRYFLSKTD